VGKRKQHGPKLKGNEGKERDKAFDKNRGIHAGGDSSKIGSLACRSRARETGVEQTFTTYNQNIGAAGEVAI